MTLSLSTRSMPLAESTGFGVVDFGRARSRTRYPAMGYRGHAWSAIDVGRVSYVSASKGRWGRFRAARSIELYDLLPALEDGPRSTRVGSASLDGLVVTRYRKAIGTSSIPVDVWIDDAGTIRQLRAATSSDSRLGPIFTTWRLPDFGTAVHIDLPSPGSVRAGRGG